MGALGYTGVALYRLGINVLVQSGRTYELVAYKDLEDQASPMLDGADETNGFQMWYDQEVRDEG
jgi:hypothetical protein